MGLFGSRTKKEPRRENDKNVSYDDALRTGSSIGKLIIRNTPLHDINS
jgi:hypothetical protein